MTRRTISGLVEIDKKAPIAISGDNVYIVWFNDQNTPNNNSEVLFRSSNDGGITFADKINLKDKRLLLILLIQSNPEMVIMSLSHGGNVIQLVKNQWSEQVRHNGATFGPILRLTSNETVGSYQYSFCFKAINFLVGTLSYCYSRLSNIVAVRLSLVMHHCYC